MRFRKLTMLAVLLLGIFCSPIDGLKILMLPINAHSHMAYFSRVGAALSTEGHVVTLFHPSNTRLPAFAGDSMNLESYQVEGKEPYASNVNASLMLIKAALSDSSLEKMSIRRTFGKEALKHLMQDCESLFADDILWKMVKLGGYDVAVVDTAGTSCYYSYVYSMGLPYVSLSVLWVPWFTYRCPALPSFQPNVAMPYSDHMTFLQRLNNLFRDVVSASIFDFFEYQNGTQTFYSTKNAPHFPPRRYSEFMRGSLLWLSLEDIALSYPKPTMPNIVNVGDVMAVQAEPLPDSLRKYLDEAENGAILMAFGSIVDFLPENITQKFCSAFSHLSQRVIWKSRTTRCDSPNVMIMPWIPQNDILAHPNLQLFISHGGYNSLLESVNHAVPLIVFPFFADQPYNAHIVVCKGYGVEMAVKTFTSQELEENVRHVLNNDSILENIRRGSSVLTNKLESPGKRISFWLNHVVKYGDSHVRSGAFELSWIQLFMVDIYLVVTAILLVVLSVLVLLLGFCFKCVRRLHRRSGRMDKKNQE